MIILHIIIHRHLKLTWKITQSRFNLNRHEMMVWKSWWSVDPGCTLPWNSCFSEIMLWDAGAGACQCRKDRPVRAIFAANGRFRKFWPGSMQSLHLKSVPFEISVTRHMNTNHERIIPLRDRPFPVKVSSAPSRIHNSERSERPIVLM
jgi:hypothetical protein